MLVPVVIFILFFATFNFIGDTYQDGQTKLQDQTAIVFEDSGFDAKNYECKRYTCTFTVAATDSNIEKFLLEKGFHKPNGSGYYKNDSLYISELGGGRYSSRNVIEE